MAGSAATQQEDDGVPTVIIVDDDPDVRGSMDNLFRSVGFATRTFGSARDAIEAGIPDTPSCYVVDVRMPRISGLEFQAALAQKGNAIPVIIVTGFGDIPMTVQAMKAGAVDFLTKPFRDQDMLDAVASAIARHRAARAGERRLAELRARLDTLTPREREVMALVVRGLMNKQVAGELGLSEITVKLHRASMLRKMQTRTVADLVRMAEALGV